MEEWRNPDNGYLNSIGCGESYIKKQIERIFNGNILDCEVKVTGNIAVTGGYSK